MAERTRVVATDMETGQSETSEISARQYTLVLGSQLELAHSQHYSNGTIVLPIKRTPSEAADE